MFAQPRNRPLVLAHLTLGMTMSASGLAQIAMGLGAATAVTATVIIVAPRFMAPDDTPAPQVIAQPAPSVTIAPDATVAPAPEVVETPVQAMTIDTFRVDQDGNMVVAGRAAAGDTVTILLDRAEIDRVTVGADGAFVSLQTLAASGDSRVLSFVSAAAGPSDRTYLIAPSAMPKVAVAAATPEITATPEVTVTPEVTAAPVEAEPEPAPEAPVEDIIVASAAEPVPEAAPAPEATPEIVIAEEPAAPTPVTPEPQVPTILVADADGVRVVQAPGPQVLTNVALDTITYDPSGDVLLAGRAAGDGFVRVYLDNQPVTTSRIASGGAWRTDLPQIDTGVYTLRVDEVSATGDVVSRVETPFKREEPQVVAEVMAQEVAREGFQVAVKTVQPGATLWAIAQERFGDGVRYVEVFEANRDLIKDPNMIFPGQVFRIPTSE